MDKLLGHLGELSAYYYINFVNILVVHEHLLLIEDGALLRAHRTSGNFLDCRGIIREYSLQLLMLRGIMLIGLGVQCIHGFIILLLHEDGKWQVQRPLAGERLSVMIVAILGVMVKHILAHLQWELLVNIEIVSRSAIRV